MDLVQYVIDWYYPFQVWTCLFGIYLRSICKTVKFMWRNSIRMNTGDRGCVDYELHKHVLLCVLYESVSETACWWDFELKSIRLSWMHVWYRDTITCTSLVIISWWSAEQTLASLSLCNSFQVDSTTIVLTNFLFLIR